MKVICFKAKQVSTVIYDFMHNGRLLHSLIISKYTNSSKQLDCKIITFCPTWHILQTIQSTANNMYQTKNSYHFPGCSWLFCPLFVNRQVIQCRYALLYLNTDKEYNSRVSLYSSSVVKQQNGNLKQIKLDLQKEKQNGSLHTMFCSREEELAPARNGFPDIF